MRNFREKCRGKARGAAVLVIREKRLRKFSEILPSLLVGACSVFLFAFPAYASSGAKQGMELCLNVVVPSLFPFFVLSNLIRGGKIAGVLGKIFAPVMKLFSLPASCCGVFVLGLLSGFPVGAEGSAALYASGGCSKTQGERLLALSNNPSPAFVISAVGAGIFKSAAIGWALFFCQLLSVFAAGIVTAHIYKEDHLVFPVKKEEKEKPFALLFTESVTDALFSVMKVCAFVIFFIMLTSLPVSMGLLPENGVGKIIFSGFCELTSGFGSLAFLPVPLAFAFSGLFLGWAGMSVHCQVGVFSLKSGLSLRPYFFSRLLQTVFCGGLTVLCSFLFFS